MYFFWVEACCCIHIKKIELLDSLSKQSLNPLLQLLEEAKHAAEYKLACWWTPWDLQNSRRC